MSRLRWPDSTNSVSEKPGTIHHLEPDSTRGAAPDFDGPDHQGQVAQLAPPAESFLIADVRLVDLHRATQPLSLGAAHGAAQFLKQGPGRFVPGNAELTLKLQRGHPRRVRRDQVRRPEPLPERRAAAVQHRPGGDRGLMPARLALPETTPREFECLRVPAARASVPVRPPGRREVGATRRLAGKAYLELRQCSREGRPRHRRPHYIEGRSESTG